VKLGLGTVQFGLKYGVSNQGGRTLPEEVSRILAFAASVGIEVLDTAPAYGESEEVLGELASPVFHFRIVTKTRSSGHQQGRFDPGEITAAFTDSLKRLKASRIYGLLVHTPKSLSGENGRRIFEELQALKAKGLVSKIGVSVYDSADIDGILSLQQLDSELQLDIVQVPINVFDQRLLKSGHLRELRERNIEIHARSVFLQGLLLMTPESLPSHLSSVRPHLEMYLRHIDALGMSPVGAAIRFAIEQPEIDIVLCGVNNLAQLEDIHQEVSCFCPKSAIDWSQFSFSQETILNPSLWASSR
jgi:aryl-alcohol dehydrogenase-like predicted oxidoreductase